MADSVSGVADEPAVTAVEIRLLKLQQLFNSLDPSPFHEKDLDADAEEYIVGSVDEFPLQQPLRLVVHLPDDQIALADTANLQDAIHNYFTYRVDETRRRLRFLLREGRIALLIGLVFLFLCMSVRELALALGHGTVSQILAEGLLILGWVAMWRPLQILLYEWWPIRHHSRVYAKLAAMPVEVRPSALPGR
jgi:hypothetical protein